MQLNSTTPAIDETIHQVQAEQDELYHCLYACIRFFPSSQETTSADPLHLTVFQGQRQAWGPIFDDLFPPSHYHRDKNCLPRTTARRSEPGLSSFHQS